MISAARRAAYDITKAVDAGRLDLASALVELRDGLADVRDRALATDIAVGTQRWRGQIDAVLERAGGRGLARFDPEVLAILRLSAYQLLHLTRVPASAVVNDAVELTRAARKRSATGLVNAVLRKVSTQPPALPGMPVDMPSAPGWREQAITYLSVTQSHPLWLVERWLDRHGWDATLAWVTFNNQVGPVTMWPAPAEHLAGTEAGATAHTWPPGRPTEWVPGGVELEDGHDSLALLRAGRAFAQDEASAAVAVVAAAVARPPVFDACASPGGKTLVLADTLQRNDLLIAGDLRPRRMQTLRRLLGRLAGRDVPLVQADACALPFTGSLGTVLIDAPCSGLGTLRRDPDVRWRRSPADLPGFVDVQRAMLREALQAVGPQGRVVYATCSSEPEENEQLVIEVTRASGWTIANLHTAALPGRLPEAIAPEGWLRTLPHRHGLESFFAAVLEPPSAVRRVESIA